MFEKKSYIKVRGIGKLNCKPELEASDLHAICLLASMIPFATDENGTIEYMPELENYAFWSSLISMTTDIVAAPAQLWSYIHSTDITDKIGAYYADYMDELYTGVAKRIAAKTVTLDPANDAALFAGIAKKLEGVDIEDILSLAQAIAQADGKEIVKAALETSAP